MAISRVAVTGLGLRAKELVIRAIDKKIAEKILGFMIGVFIDL